MESLDQKTHYNRIHKEKFETYAQDPDSLKGIYFPMSFFKPNRIIIDKIRSFCRNDFSGLAILDLGCGEGAFACYIASLGASVTAVDISEVNIDITKLRAEVNSISNVEAIVASCTNTGLRSSSFDIITGKALIHHLLVEEESLLYKEVSRLLRPGGHAIFMESIQNSRALEFVRTLIPIPLKHDPRPSRLSKSWRQFDLNDPHPERPNTTRHYQESLRDLRFKNVELEEIGIFSRLDRFITDGKMRTWIHDIDYAIKPLIPFNSLWARNILITIYN